jgi:nucleoid-associated protein YgaU
MGRLEKIVVSVVLFLVAIILGISLGTDTPAAGGAQASKPSAPRNPAAAGQPAANPNAPAGVMSTGLTPGAGAQPANVPSNAPANPAANPNGAAPAATPVGGQAPVVGPGAVNPAGATGAGAAPAGQGAAPATPFLVTREGLTPTASEEFMAYTWQAGDTFPALAQRYYGSANHGPRIRAANEGRTVASLAPGDRILIPSMATLESDRIARPSARDPQGGATNAGAVAGATYTVAAGDVLGTISKKVYGTASKWQKIHDANRDVIGADPNRLKPGMVLRIPQ